MQVVIFDVKYKSLFSILCSIVTGQSSSHAAIIEDGVLYDTTLLRGHFDRASPWDVLAYDKRQVTVFDLPEHDATEWLRGHIGTPYDYKGLLLWPLGLESKDRTYCFQAVAQCLTALGVLDLPSKVSAKELFYGLLAKGYRAERTTAARLQVTPE